MQDWWLIRPWATYTLLLPWTARSALGQDPALLEQGQEAWEKPPSAREEFPRSLEEEEQRCRAGRSGEENPATLATCSLIDFPCRTLSHTLLVAAVPHFPEAILHSAARGRERLEKSGRTVCWWRKKTLHGASGSLRHGSKETTENLGHGSSFSLFKTVCHLQNEEHKFQSGHLSHPLQVGLPDLENKNVGCSVKFELQVKNE